MEDGSEALTLVAKNTALGTQGTEEFNYEKWPIAGMVVCACRRITSPGVLSQTEHHSEVLSLGLSVLDETWLCSPG